MKLQCQNNKQQMVSTWCGPLRREYKNGTVIVLTCGGCAFLSSKTKTFKFVTMNGNLCFVIFSSRSVLVRSHILNMEKLGVWGLNPDLYMYYVMFLSIELNSHKLFLWFISMKVFLGYKICVFIWFSTFILFFLWTYYSIEHTF